MPRGIMADAPAGFIAMCERDRDLCMLGRSAEAPASQARVTAGIAPDARSEATGTGALQPEPTVARMTPSTPWSTPARNDDPQSLIKTVNKQVNRHVTQMTDFKSSGVGEYWQRLQDPLPVGDCEDIAIEKRIRLTDAGFPAERLFYAVAFVRNIGLHTVLVARMDDGDYVLDSLTPRIVRWEDAHYVWLRKQVAGSPLRWERIDRGALGTTLAAGDAGTANPAS